jgi:phosphate starvation-inducible PhoH-like protein
MAKRTRQASARQLHSEEGEVRAFYPDRAGWGSLGGGSSRRDPSYVRNSRPHSDKQRQLTEATTARDMIPALGPAGTGKTYIAIVKVDEALEADKAAHMRWNTPNNAFVAAVNSSPPPLLFV